MPRRGNVPKRDVLPDPVYGSKVVAKLINQIMLDGNKATAQKIVYDAFDMMREKLGKEPLEIFNQAMANVMPVLEVKARRVGGANYQVPIEIRPERRQTLAIRWIVINTRKRSEREMSKKTCSGADGRVQQRGRFRQEKGRHAPHGGSEQSVRAFQILTEGVEYAQTIRS